MSAVSPARIATVRAEAYWAAERARIVVSELCRRRLQVFHRTFLGGFVARRHIVELDENALIHCLTGSGISQSPKF